MYDKFITLKLIYFRLKSFVIFQKILYVIEYSIILYFLAKFYKQ